MNFRHILTGAPGTGKSTLLKHLETKGVDVVPEPARIILAEQRAKGGSGVPEKDAVLFTSLMLDRALDSWQKAETNQGPVVFDRGVADNIAYARLFGIDETPYWEAARRHPYHHKVFICPPWEAIYTQDEERRMAFDDVLSFHKTLMEVYEKLDYYLLEMPLAPVEIRAQFYMEQA